MEQNKLITDEERAVLMALADAWNKFVGLEQIHEAEQSEFARAIHAAQNMIASRSVYRALRDEEQENIQPNGASHKAS